MRPPPMMAAIDAVWCGSRKGRDREMPPSDGPELEESDRKKLMSWIEGRLPKLKCSHPHHAGRYQIALGLAGQELAEGVGIAAFSLPGGVDPDAADAPTYLAANPAVEKTFLEISGDIEEINDARPVGSPEEGVVAAVDPRHVCTLFHWQNRSRCV